MPIDARVIAHSVSAAGGPPLITMQVTMHRYVLAEFNTHRVMSRSFRSSRAVPVAKLIEEVRTAPAEPVVWLKNKPGMQATEPMTAEEEAAARADWLDGANETADSRR
jgi:mannose/cellobiose epimerase-like protein (N-acyl-D-glucosamine 2-epimerase family)